MEHLLEQDVPHLFCKPKGYHTSSFKHYFGYHLVEFRSVDLARDIEMIHDWVHSEHAQPYWQLNVTIGELYTIYATILQSPASHSYIGLYDNTPVCQIDLYLASIDEVSKHIDVNQNDCGMHLLMAPLRKPINGLSLLMTNAFLLYFFSHHEAYRMYGEPDVNNDKANVFIKKVGFQFIKQVKMSYKDANLYMLSKEAFFRKNKLENSS